VSAAASPRSRLPRAERERQAVRVAHAMFAQRGYAAVTMDEVAEALGVTKPILYRYFGNKDGLYLACLDRAGAGLLTAVAVAGRQAGRDRRDALRAGVAAFFAFLDEDRDAWRVLFDDSRPPGGPASDRVRHYRERLRELAAAALPAEGPAGEALSAALLAAAEATGRWWLEHGSASMTAAQTADLLIAALEPGLLAEPR
jgi:AcrR family transcriptional regulator